MNQPDPYILKTDGSLTAVRPRPCGRTHASIAHWLVAAGLSVLTLTGWCGSEAFGQNPFAPGGNAAPVPAAPADPADADAADPTNPSALETDPTVLALRDLNPTTPLELAKAVQAMTNYQRPDEAQRYLEMLAATNPDTATLVQLHDTFGSGLFLRWLRSDNLGPQAAPLAQKVLAAAEAASKDAAQLAAAVEQLADPSLSVRGPALARLRAANEAGVVALLKATAAGVDADHQAEIRKALLYLGPVTEGPLLAAVQSSDEHLQAEAAFLLGRRNEERAVKYLLAPFRTADTARLRDAAGAALLRIVGEIPSEADATIYLKRRITDFLNGMLPGRPGVDEQIAVWSWDDSAGEPVLQQLEPPLASALVAYRLASDLRRLQPNDTDVERLYLLAALKAAKLDAGVDQPLPRGPDTLREAAAARGPEMLNSVLQQAIADGQLIAAAAAAEVLGDVLLEQDLVAADGRPVPLVAALDHPDRRLRFAAASAVVQIDPQIPYAGSSKLTDALVYFSRSGGMRRVLIGHPRVTYGQSLVALFHEAGYAADLVTSGEAFYDAAKLGPDYEFGMIADSLQAPYVDKLMSMLRHDPRTAQLPLVILARHGNLERAQDLLASRDDRTLALPRLYDLEGVGLAVAEMHRLAEQPPLTEAVREYHAVQATGWLAEFAEPLRGHPIYNVLRHEDALLDSIELPAVSHLVIEAVGHLATPKSQQRLVDLASDIGRPLTIREAAAAAFAEAVRRRGVLLTREAVLLQYDRYNESENLDQPTQVLLGSILDAIEDRWPPGADPTPPSAAEALDPPEPPAADVPEPGPNGPEPPDAGNPVP